MLQRLSLKTVYLLDALLTGATGVLMVAGAWFLDGLLDLPVNLIWIAGVVLVVYVAGLLAIARQDPINPSLVTLTAAINVAWGIGCVALLLSGKVEPNALGVAFILLQVVVVALFAGLQLAKNGQAGSRSAGALLA
jgi:hypothetical protein